MPGVRPDGESQAVCREMTDCLTHRGPDDGGIWADPKGDLLLGHRRLAIIDLSPEGRQPMTSRSGRFVIAYNGEIYNFAELRRRLEGGGVRFHGHSDTEVLLEAAEAWGIDEALRACVGMFVFALWDRSERRLYLGRDRLGIKPLFIGTARGRNGSRGPHGAGGGPAGGSGPHPPLIFSSELKSFLVHPGFRREIREDVLPLYLRYNYIPSPHSVYRDAKKVLPGTYLTVDAERWNGDLDSLQEVRYWSARKTALAGLEAPLDLPDEEAVDLLEEVLATAVRDRLVSDVPLGAFLSGGVDSSTVVSLMQEASPDPVKTFSIGFAEEQFDEARYASEVARHLGTDHTELLLSPKEAMDVIPLLPDMYDEPYSDYSNIPTYLVSKLARGQVTVSLSGDGGDELFGGYNRHIWLAGLWRKMGRVPRLARKAASSGLLALSPQAWDRLYGAFGFLLPRRLSLVDPGYKIHKLAGVMGAGDPLELYHGVVSEWKRPLDALRSGKALAPPVLDDPAWRQMRGVTEAIMYLDLVTYLPDDILTKVDRASMAVSLESRVPILDHRVAELAWKLPLHQKVRGGEGKWALRQLLYRRVPRELIERPKMGFTVPVGLWLRGPLRDWAEELLDPAQLADGGFFRPKVIRGLWQEHLSGRRNRDSLLWPVLMFQAWRKDGPG